MQILEDNIEDYGDLAQRIADLRKKVAKLLEQNQKIAATKESVVTKVKEVIVESPENKELVEKIKSLEAQLAAKPARTELSSASNDDLVQENIFLKKQLEDKDKTIKELGFKLEMLKMAKNLRSGAMVNEKSDELKKIITEYIKELDKSIASLNIK